MNFANIFKALGDETRLRLLNLFLQKKQKICVGELVDSLWLPQYLISRHLTVLRNLGLVKTDREGTWIYYKANWEASECIADLLKIIKKHFKTIYAEDIRRLENRLSQRQNGHCVLGFTFYNQTKKAKKPLNK